MRHIVNPAVLEQPLRVDGELGAKSELHNRSIPPCKENSMAILLHFREFRSVTYITILTPPLRPVI